MTSLPDSDPYPWPFDGCIDGHRLALLITGAQRAWAERCADPFPALAALVAIADDVRNVGGTVIAVHHLERRPAGTGRPSVLPRTGTHRAGSVLPDALPVTDVVEAGGIDGFWSSSLDDVLRSTGRTQLLVGGLASELTVDSTLRSANDRGYECLVLTDACAPIDPDLAARAFQSVTMSGGIFGALGTTRSLRAALRDHRPVPSPAVRATAPDAPITLEHR
jgi:biuret amidohydrolase